MARATVTLLTLVSLFVSHCSAAPRPLTAEELAVAGLDFPALDKRADNSTDSSWLLRMIKRDNDDGIVSLKVGGKVPIVNTKTQATSTRKSTATSTKKPKTTSKAKETHHKTTTKKATNTAKKTSTTTKAKATATQTSSGSTAKLAPVPANVQTLYDQLANKQCQNQLDTKPGGYQMNGDGGNWAHFCGNTKSKPEVVYWMSNMDIDCDGATKSGPCGNDPSHLDETAFEYKGKPVDASTVPYVVINDDKYFSPAKFGIQGLATVGVVCGGKLTWGVFADTNALGSMGEASVDMGRLCFGDSINGNNGYSPADVLYFAFTGADAVDPLGGTNWDALAARGNSLLSRL